jgi:hypothetical protein
MNKQRAQIGVAALADSQQIRLSAGRVLLGQQAQPSRQLPAVRKILRIANRSNRGTGRDRTDLLREPGTHCLPNQCQLS